MSKIDVNKTTWNLDLLLADASPENIDRIKKTVSDKVIAFANKWRDRDDYVKIPEVLCEALEDYEELMSEFGLDGSLGYFFFLRGAQDSQSNSIKAQGNDITNFSMKLSHAIRFFGMNVSKINPELQENFLNYPGLLKYKHYLEQSFANAKYLLSEKEEKIITLSSIPAVSNWTQMVSEFLAREEAIVLNENKQKVKLPLEAIYALVSNKDKQIRDVAEKAISKATKKHADVATAELNSLLQFKKDIDELRGYSRPDEERHIDDDIETSVVDVLVEAVTQRYDVAHKFYELKTRLLGLDKLEYHERGVEYGEVDKHYSYEEAVEIVRLTLRGLNKQFEEIFDNFVRNGHIDVYPNKGKVGGAFCIHNLISQPVYILLNFTNKLDDVMTLAHEMGHAINYELMRKQQNALNFGTSTATAEVASTFVEDFVLNELTKTASDEEKLAIMVKKAGEEIKAIQAQVAFYRFEQEMHTEFGKASYLPKETIGKLFQKHMTQYAGKFVKPTKGLNNRWVAIPHFRTPFYVYSYASGQLISKSLQNTVRQNANFVDNVKEFLKVGTSKSPRVAFLDLGIDITNIEFWNKGINEQAMLNQQIEELARKLGKI